MTGLDPTLHKTGTSMVERLDVVRLAVGRPNASDALNRSPKTGRDSPGLFVIAKVGDKSGDKSNTGEPSSAWRYA